MNRKMTYNSTLELIDTIFMRKCKRINISTGYANTFEHIEDIFTKALTETRVEYLHTS